MRAIRETSCHMVWRRYEEVGGGRWRAGGECGSASETLCEAGPFLEVVAITHEIQFRTPYKSISIHCNNNQDYATQMLTFFNTIFDVDIAVFPSFSDPVDVKEGDQHCETVCVSAIHSAG